MRKLSHETLNHQRVAQLSETYRAFNPGDEVMTVDGVAGRITAVLDGPYPQTEEYEVLLHGGAGGGQYTAGQLRAASALTASSMLVVSVEGDEDGQDGETDDNLDPYEASVGLHEATVDYPELGSILTDRLPNENLRVTAALNEPFDEESRPDEAMETSNPDKATTEKLDKAQSEGQDHPMLEDIGQPDSCSFCGSPQFDEFTNTGRGTRARCAQCGGTMTSWGGQWQPDPPNSPENAASRQGDFRSTINDLDAVHGAYHFGDQVMARYDLLGTGDPELMAIAANPHADAVAALLGIKHTGEGEFRTFTPSERAEYFEHRSSVDPDLGFHMTATWADVRRKAKAIKDEGGVRITAATQLQVVGEVQGEHHLYESSINYVPGTHKVADWHCGCKWGAYAWGRAPQYKRFEGRQCSHVTALQYEAQSRGMFGREVGHDTERADGQYQRTPITVEYQRPTERAPGRNINRRTVPPGNMKRTFSVLDEGAGFVVSAGLWALPDAKPTVTRHGDLDESEHSGHISAMDDAGHYAGSVSYHLEPHHDEIGGTIHHQIDVEPGMEHHEQGLFHALEDHLKSHGLSDGLWTHDNDGYQAAQTLGVTPHYASLDVSPIEVFAAEMYERGDDPRAITAMLASYGVKVAAEATAPEDGGSASPGTDIPRLDKRDTTDMKKDPRHRKHHTNDAREHAPEFGHGIPWNIGPLVWCDQCNGGGCGHCGGTGQVVPALTPTGGPGVGDASSTSSPVADQNADAGAMVSSDGMSATGVQHYADYTADSFLTGPPAQDYNPQTPHSNSPNPGSTGWGTSADPNGWENPIIGDGFASFMNTAKAEGEVSVEPPTVSGVALKAADTGRVLMIQRSIKDEKDPARGTWEFPGGHHEEGDLTSLHAGVREWEEEVGQSFPEGGHVAHTWRSGPYQGHVVVVPSEDHVKFHEGRSTTNPDDPDGDDHEQSVWMHPDDAKKMPNLRSELKAANPWSGIAKAASHEYPVSDTETMPYGYDDLTEFREDHPDRIPKGASREAGSRDCPTCHGTGEVGRGKECDRCDGSGYLTPHDATLHDEPEAALPSTDGNNNDDGPDSNSDPDQDLADALSQSSPAKEDISSVPGGMMLEAQPDVPWGFSQDDPLAAPGTGGTADTDEPVDSNTMNEPFHNEAAIHEGMSEVEIIAAFQSTAGARALNAEGPAPELNDRQAAMAGATSAKGGDFTDGQIAAYAQEVLRKASMKDFNFAEQQDLISEGATDGSRTRNFDDMQIEGTHYARIAANSPVIDDDQFLLL